MTYQVQRGGTWFFRTEQQAYLRLSYRRAAPHYQDDLVGFRVVCLPREVAPPRMLPPLRGGSWGNNPGFCRSACRGFGRFQPGYASSGLGFRVVCLPLGVKPTQVTMRGGSHAQLSYPWCRSTCRGISHSPDYADYDLGFRVICLPRGMTP